MTRRRDEAGQLVEVDVADERGPVQQHDEVEQAQVPSAGEEDLVGRRRPDPLDRVEPDGVRQSDGADARA